MGRQMLHTRKKQTSSINIHLRFREAEVSQSLMQRHALKQLLTPKVSESSTYELSCCHYRDIRA